MTRFEKVSKYKDVDLPMPTRATANSAAYDLCVAEDTIVKPYDFLHSKIQEHFLENERHEDFFGFLKPFDLEEVAAATSELKARPTLVPTGMRCKMEPNQYMELYLRSSTPLKYWLIMANANGVIDSDYYNAENEGHIFVQIINLLPFAIKLKRGDRIAQAIIKSYEVTDDDNAAGERTGGFGSTSDK